MNITLLKALIALLPTGMLFSGSVVLFPEKKDCGLFPTASRRGVFGAGRAYSCRRSTSRVSLDPLGA